MVYVIGLFQDRGADALLSKKQSDDQASGPGAYYDDLVQISVSVACVCINGWLTYIKIFPVVVCHICKTRSVVLSV